MLIKKHFFSTILFCTTVFSVNALPTNLNLNLNLSQEEESAITRGVIVAISKIATLKFEKYDKRATLLKLGADLARIRHRVVTYQKHPYPQVMPATQDGFFLFDCLQVGKHALELFLKSPKKKRNYDRERNRYGRDESNENDDEDDDIDYGVAILDVVVASALEAGLAHLFNQIAYNPALPAESKTVAYCADGLGSLVRLCSICSQSKSPVAKEITKGLVKAVFFAFRAYLEEAARQQAKQAYQQQADGESQNSQQYSQNSSQHSYQQGARQNSSGFNTGTQSSSQPAKTAVQLYEENASIDQISRQTKEAEKLVAVALRTLDLLSDSSKSEIKKVFHKLSLRFHPDKIDKTLPLDQQKRAEEIFKLVNAAYNKLA